MTYPRVYVKWRDAMSTDDWVDVATVEDTPAVIHTLGFLLSEHPDFIRVAQNLDGEGTQCSMIMIIPREWCLTIKRLDSE